MQKVDLRTKAMIQEKFAIEVAKKFFILDIYFN